MSIRKSKALQAPLVKKPLLFCYNVVWRALYRLLTDKQFLSLKYWLVFHKKLNWETPLTYSEKIQWLKLYGRTPINTVMADKYAVKAYIEDMIGGQYVVPLLGVWDAPEQIDFDGLPNQFVLKCNHNSGLGMCICRDKSKLNLVDVKKKLDRGLKEDFFLQSREKAYKNIPHKIIAEKYLEDSETKELRDYKFFCFDGVPKVLFIASGRLKGEDSVTFDFFDMNFSHLPITNGHPNARVAPHKPKCFEEMKELASKLSQNIPHVRVDFYEVDGKVYFGEFTFSHWGGLMPFEPKEWDLIFGGWIKLPSN